jgi:hypothetical protein
MEQNDQELLARLQRSGVEFVIIGGVCAVMHGVPLVTRDLDICIRISRENLYRLESAVKDLHPFHRLAANKMPLELTDDLCAQLRNVYLQTDIGKLDCLGEVAGVGDYNQCLARSVVFRFSFGQFRILDVNALIAAKEAAGRDRDKQALYFLRAIAERKKQQPDLL